MESAFEQFGLQPSLLQAIVELGYEQPTPIQLQAIPALMEGRNVLGQAQTGTGKTAAFMLPMLQAIEPKTGYVQALVLAPTRELAIQVADAAGSMARLSPVQVMAVYGGQSYDIQIRKLKRGVDMVVGTPGRLLDLLEKKVLDLSQVRYLVIDEADEMLDMGFIEDIEAILAQMPTERQTALFSATLPEAIRKLAERYIQEPHVIRIDPTRRTVEETEQSFVLVREEDKLTALVRLLEAEEVKSALIFARTKMRTQELADELAARGYGAEALHGDLNQSRREYVLKRFRAGIASLLVATDVAARGLDIENVSHVFNYDAPSDPEDYVHRIGRTGRAGRKGVAISLFSPRDRVRQRQIEAYTHQKIEPRPIPSLEAIAARRDDLLMQRLAEKVMAEDSAHERELVAQLAAGGWDLLDLAAAALKMARGEEKAFPAGEIQEMYVREERRGRHSDERGDSQGKRSYRSERSNGKEHARGEGAPRRGSRPEDNAGMIRLWMNMGITHGLRPGDVVGAIAGEVGIPGKAIGNIDIHNDHSFVFVSEKHVRRVLRESAGNYSVKGKPVMLKLAD